MDYCVTDTEDGDAHKDDEKAEVEPLVGEFCFIIYFIIARNR